MIGCDVGSQSLKGILLDPSGAVIAQANAAYDVEYPHPAWAQQDARDWRRALTDVIGSLRLQADVPAEAIGVLGLASQVDGLVAVDADGEPLHPAIIWLDRRAAAQTRALAASAGEAADAADAAGAATPRLDRDEIRRITGLNLDASHVAPKILWLREEHPEVVERAAGLLLP
ncbi:MAG TPA: FGGY family carbohydrate kinase, partial [Candidatus Limnocylindrales bacterium]